MRHGITTLGLLCCVAAAGMDGFSSFAKDVPTPTDVGPKSFTERLSDKVSFEMIAVPGGIFTIGSPENESGRDDHEGPQRTVRVKPFWMGRCEVTWNEYDLYWIKRVPAKEVPKEKRDPADAISRPSPPYHDESFGYGRDGYPVISISYHSAMQYCSWLSAKTGKHYRLPTEAEWEWACRAGTKGAYSFGDPKAIGDHAWYAENSNEEPHPVGKKKTNPWGLCDMHGNVAEWCIDSYQDDAYAALPNGAVAVQPVNLPRNARYPYVVRGGSWTHKAEKCRSATRLASTPEWNRRDPGDNPSIWWLTDADFVGFRVVCVSPENDNLKGIRSPITTKSPGLAKD